MVAKGDCGDHGGRLICPQDKALRRKSFLANPFSQILPSMKPLICQRLGKGTGLPRSGGKVDCEGCQVADPVPVLHADGVGSTGGRFEFRSVGNAAELVMIWPSGD